MGHRRKGVGNRLKVPMRSDWANDLITGLKRLPTRVRDGAKMALEGSLKGVVSCQRFESTHLTFGVINLSK